MNLVGRHCRWLTAFALLAGWATAASAATPVPPACDDATFLRRASLDLVGRQPTPAEIEAFLADAAPHVAAGFQPAGCVWQLGFGPGDERGWLASSAG